MTAEEKLIITKKGKNIISLQEQKENHPLVKDKRCFNFNYWIDPIPNCLQDEE